jgi:large repetitive protein
MRLGLLDLIRPQFLIDFRLPDEIHEIVSFLRVAELDSAWDETGVVHTGKAVFEGPAGASPVPVQKRPSGEVFEWGDVKVQFRLTIPRNGAPDLKQVIDKAASIGGTSGPIGNLQATVNRFGTVPATGQSSDYPGFAFKLELLLSSITLHLPKKTFVPARLAADGRLEPDPTIEDVRIKLPKIAISVTRDNKAFSADADFDGWGVTGLDDELDTAAGELISMVPPLALHESGVFGFGLEKAVLDLSADHTPPEILELFGTDQDFKGLWLPHVRIFVAPKGATGLSFDLRANDLLIDFRQGVSGEFTAEVINSFDGKVVVQPRFYEGERQILPVRGYNLPGDPRSTTIRGSRASVAADGELQLAINGGHAPYTITVTRDGQPIQQTPYTPPGGGAPVPNRFTWLLAGTPKGTAHLKVHVVDSGPEGKVSVFDEEIEVAVREAGNRIGSATILPVPTLTELPGGTDGYRLALSDSQPDPGAVILQASPTPIQNVTVTGANVSPSTAGEVRVPVTSGGPSVTVAATWPTAASAPFEVRFTTDSPSDGEFDLEVERITSTFGAELRDLIARAAGNPIDVIGRASYEGDPSSNEYKQALSVQRAEVLKAALQQIQSTNGLPTAAVNTQGKGFDEARNSFDFAKPSYAAAAFDTATAALQPVGTAPTRAVSVARPQAVEVPIVIPTERGPAPLEPERPAFFRKIKLRVRLERNKLVLFEISGEVDFKTAAEERAQVIKANANKQPVTDQVGSGLAVQTQPGASADPTNNPGDGIVDYRLLVSYDSATGKLAEELAFGSGETDRDGLVQIKNATPPAAIGNVAGALMVFAPLLAKSIDTAVTPGGGSAAVPLALGAGEIGTAATLGLTGAVSMQRITWFGAELTARQTLATTKTFDETALLLDYAVDFFVKINIGPLKINSKPETPLRVRYKALGFKLNFGKGKAFSPVFDTSKGYQLDLADPGLFEVSSPFGDIIKVLGARVAKTNPTVLELDLGMKVNLGVITVDTIRVTWPLDPAGPPTLLPTGVSVNVPGVISGSGFIDPRNGIKGSLDLTLVPVKLRMAGAIAIQPMAPPLTPPGRKVTAVYVALQIEFPTAIPLGSSGLGLYGILGLFGMHFKRNENKAAEVPALDWLSSVDGDPTGITGNPPQLKGWVPDVDRWAFGVGAVLGTLGSGTILNLKGMLVLELPGPRILLFVKLQILAKQPPTKGDVKQLGILAVVDLDFELHQLTIGVSIAYDIEKILSVKLPVKARFNLDVAKDWELDIGTIQNPASALVLNIVKATGYLMFAGEQITGFPLPPDRHLGVLKGFAIAAGVRASVEFGNKNINLYLAVTAQLDAALVFSPFHVYGIMELKGQLHLFIISLSASATLDVDAPNPTIVNGKACASIDLFFFELEGCVEIHIGPDDPAVLEPPPLIDGMVLQSRSPALLQGQGTDQPIDAKLCDAVEVGIASPDKNDPVVKDLKRVPIDSVPILKMHAAPSEESAATFTRALKKPPRQMPPLDPNSGSGWMDQGGGRWVRYVLQSLEIQPPVPVTAEGLPPATWRAESKAPQGQDSAVDLALFSWDPVSDPRAAQRSEELTKRLTNRWGGVCTARAEAARVVWTFNKQPLGPGSGTWVLTGTPQPDMATTLRSAPPDTTLVVHAPPFDPLQAALDADAGKGNLESARVVGFDGRVGGAFKNYFMTASAGHALQLPFVHRKEPPPPIIVPRIAAEVPAAATTASTSSATAGDTMESRELAVATASHTGLLSDPMPRRVTIESGQIQIARLLLAQHVSTQINQVLFRAYDAAGNLIKTDSESTLGFQIVTQLDHLPAEWLNGPMAQDVTAAFNVLKQLHQRAGTSLAFRLVQYIPPPNMVRFEVAADVQIGQSLPVLYLGAIELLRNSEVDRAAHDHKVRLDEIKTIEDALAPDQPRPLLAPDTRYTISATYRAEVRQNDKEDPTKFTFKPFTHTQNFTFVTDAAPPERINPWVLATTPAADEPAHFADDPVRVIFNDRSAIQLFKAYGKDLRIVVRQSNGNHPTEKPALTTDKLTPLTGRKLRTPFHETLYNILQSNPKPCVQLPDLEKHRSFDLKMQLERATSYTVDVEPTDLTAYPTEADAPTRVPLFRTAFTTSRFRNISELAGIIRSSKVKHRTLKALSADDPFAGLPPTLTDTELETALAKAGLEPAPGAVQPGVTLLWRPTSGGDFTLVAALLDAPEPLWRTRMEPDKHTETSDNGTMTHYVGIRREWLHVVESGTGVVSKAIHSTAGTRGLFLLTPGATLLKLALRRHEHTLVSETSFTDAELISANLPAVPPWRSDDA